VVKIIAFLELKQKLTFFKGLLYLNKEKLFKIRAGKNELHLTHEIQQVNAKKY